MQLLPLNVKTVSADYPGVASQHAGSGVEKGLIFPYTGREPVWPSGEALGW